MSFCSIIQSEVIILFFKKWVENVVLCPAELAV